MFNRLWQRAMIALARSPRVTRFMQDHRATTRLSRKYVAGDDPRAGLTTARELLAVKGLRSSLYYLGEYVDRPELVAENLANKLAIAQLLGDSELDIHLSVDPTQIGYALDPALLRDNAGRIAAAVRAAIGDRPGLHCLMIDMEDATVVDDTIALCDALRAQGYPVALTLQAYLRRTACDLAAQIEAGGKVRLVKGAFVGTPAIAYTRAAGIKDNYRRLVTRMLSPEARANGFYPIIATHDDRIQDFAIECARRNGWQPGEYEFEMLLGVRTDVAEALVARGERVRIYVPFGRDWWPYAVRRIGENPRSAVLLGRSLIG
ncbi:MAG: proline dehydrogenase family protein [Gammaproteobacteria bacterium]|nr:proline dehydrogenase family protein [Gammaproteobacteria bacterium]